jgi:hypothetical protein
VRNCLTDKESPSEPVYRSRDRGRKRRMQLAKHLQEILLTPRYGDEIKYTGNGGLLGDGGNVDGAEGQNRTGYAGLFRAALYR